MRCSFCFVFTFVCRQTDVPDPIKIWGAGPGTISCLEKVMHTASTSVLLFCRKDLTVILLCFFVFFNRCLDQTMPVKLKGYLLRVNLD